MRDSYPQLLGALFDDETFVSKNEPLHKIKKHALELLELNRVVKSLLPTQLHLLCRVANLRNNILVLEVANASWMIRLRHEKPMLLSAMRKRMLPSLSLINIKINPDLMAQWVVK